MRVKVSDYIADFLVGHGIKDVFSVVGGGAMHLNDSFGHHPQLHCLYNHHEQASAMAAEAYARINNKPAVVCVTSGPGAVNALNGVVGAFQDSIPMIVISGQAKTSLCIRTSGVNVRTIGGQEVDIVPVVQQNMVKYAEMVMKANDIRKCLEKAFTVAVSGRPGPCWIDVPVDVQGTFVESDDLVGYDEVMDSEYWMLDEKIIDLIQIKLSTAKRPVIYAGNGIRLSGGKCIFDNLVKKLNIPVVTCWDSIDLIDTDN